MVKRVYFSKDSLKGKSKLYHKDHDKFLKLLGKGYTAQKIAVELNLKIVSVYKRLRTYIKNGLINQDKTLTSKGVYFLDGVVAGINKVNTLPSDTIRLHNLVFKINIKVDNWKDRTELLKIKNIDFKPLNLVRGAAQSLIIDNVKVWLTNKNIILYMPNYYGKDNQEPAEVVFGRALDDLILNYVPKLERLLGIDLHKSRINVSRNHYALIKNYLAKQYDKEKKKLFVMDDKGIWLIIDNSLNLHELETIRPKTAMEDNLIVQDFFNDLKQNPITPSQILQMQYNESQKMSFYAKHIESHTSSIIKLDQSISIMNDLLKKLLEAQHEH